MRSLKILLPLCLILSFGATSANPPEIGDSYSTVIRSMGHPRGTVQVGDRMSMVYPHGRILLYQSQVVEVDLMTPEKFRVHQATIERRRQEAAHLAEVQAQQAAEEAKAKEALRATQALRRTEGEALRADMVEHPRFQQLTPFAQAAILESFSKEYPEVNVEQDLASLRNQMHDILWTHHHAEPPLNPLNPSPFYRIYRPQPGEPQMSQAEIARQAMRDIAEHRTTLQMQRRARMLREAREAREAQNTQAP